MRLSSRLISAACFLVLAYSVAQTHVSAENPIFGQVVQWQGLSAAAAPLFVDLDPDGQAEAMVMEEGQCQVYRAVEDRFEPAARLALEGKRFISANAADLNGDGKIEVVLGSDDLGYLAVFAFGAEPALLTLSRHTWKAVSQIVPADADGDGRKDVFAVASDGDAMLFRYSGNSLDPAWRGTKTFPAGAAISAAQLDGKGPEELIVIDRSRGGFSIFGWQNGVLRKTYENFPWGGIMDAAAGDVNGDGACEIVVSSGRRLLYVLAYGKGQIMAPVQLPVVGVSVLFPVRYGAPALGLVSTAGEVLIYEWTKSGPALSLRSKVVTRVLSAARLRDSEFIMFSSGGALFSAALIPFDLTDLPVFQGGRRTNWSVRWKGTGYFPFEQLLEALELEHEWDAQTKTGKVRDARGTWTFTVGSTLVEFSEGEPAALAHEPFEWDGQVFVPSDFVELVAPKRVLWNSARNLFAIRPPAPLMP